MSTAEITIRSIQHYLYCPHRWGLLEIDKAWEENFFVTKANLIHDRVHNPEQHYNAKGKKFLLTLYLLKANSWQRFVEKQRGMYFYG